MSNPPTNPDELPAYIRYRLGALVEENAHHRFEDLCFRIAKATVATNLVPPTGPVSAGGDQGRDFESYQVSGDGGAVTRIFAACVKSSDTLVFACTTQRGSSADLVRKAKSDINTACQREPKPTVVYYYVASATLPPKPRHDLQDWARSAHGLHLEVVDQKLLSEILTEAPNQSLAQHYLQVPSAMLGTGSPTVAVPDWYADARTRFSVPSERQIDTHAEVALVVRCARHAWSDEDLTGDDALWLDVLSDMWGAPGAMDTEDGLRAFYEMFVFLLRGRERCGVESHIPAYVEALVRFDRLGLARDAQCFASYLVGGAQRGLIDLPKDQVKHLFETLLAWLMGKIDTAPGPVVLSDLLVARGSLVFTPLGLDGERPDDAVVAKLATETLDWWSQALDVGERLVSFPVLHLGELVTNIAPILAESPEFDAFIERLDSASEGRLSSEALAASNRDRASALFQAGKPLEALAPMLAARRHWHNGDRIRGSLLSSTLAVECLRKLGLMWAAKRTLYDIIAVCNRVGDKEHADMLTAAVFSLAEIAYLSGDWAEATQHYALGLTLHVEFVADPWNWEKHHALQAGAFYLVNMVVAGELVAPGFRDWALKVASDWELDDELEKFGDTVLETWSKHGITGGAASPEIPLFSPPLSDVGTVRSARWTALGTDWRFHWTNEYATEAAAIELLGVLQFMIAGLAKRYLHLLPSTVTVAIRPWDIAHSPVESTMEEVGASFIVRIPSADTAEDPTRDARTVALYASTRILQALSVDADFEDVLPKLTGSLIGNAVFVGASPTEGREQVFPRERWEHTQTVPIPIGAAMEVPSHVCEALPWRSGQSPAYSEETSQEKLKLRYEGGFRTVEPVLRAHKLNPKCRKFVAELRGEGWLDWQIASALAPAVVSERANAMGRRGASRRTIDQAFRDGMEAARRGDYTAPPWSPSLEEAVRHTLTSSLLSALGVWDLKVQHAVVDVDAVKRFLRERFRHFSDDIPLEDRRCFPWEEAS